MDEDIQTYVEIMKNVTTPQEEIYATPSRVKEKEQ